MRYRALHIIVFAALMLNAVSAQEYQLGWGEVNKSAKNVENSYTLDWSSVDRHVDKAEPKPVVVAAQPIIKDVIPPALPNAPQTRPIPLKAEKPTTFDITLTASQFYDHYAGRYKMVSAIELHTKRDGRTVCELIENRGQYRQMEVSLPKMQPGDSYKARIIWDDGSNRTVEKTIAKTFVDRKIYIDQPDYLAYSAW